MEVLEKKTREVPHITEVEAAEEYIEFLLNQGEFPVVTIPRRYLPALSHGLSPHSSWIPDLSVISGTLGREPYDSSKEPRVVVKVHVQKDHIHPRFTGPDHTFQGVVVIDGPVGPEAIELIDQD